MTQYIYLAAPGRLPTGSFGQNPVSPEQPNVFATEVDFAHLYFAGNYDPNTKTRVSYSSHLTYDYQVAEGGGLPTRRHARGTAAEEKCFRILYAYIEEALQKHGVVEYFSSWNGEEELPLLERKTVRWAEIKKPYDLVLHDRELWEITW